MRNLSQMAFSPLSPHSSSLCPSHSKISSLQIRTECSFQYMCSQGDILGALGSGQA